ncbi:hypothetical protein GFS60_03508 [Rhodococcus sp. WAY2]|nr:hypothetical protein GFS60_03508 [Rhodococcus sp. WAY2]
MRGRVIDSGDDFTGAVDSDADVPTDMAELLDGKKLEGGG